MRIKYLFLVMLCSIALQSKAQYFEHDLRKHTWLCTDGFAAANLFDWYITFTDGNANFLMKDKDTGNVVSNFDYRIYLTSDKAETTKFDSTMIGKDLFGKYIMMNRKHKTKEKIINDVNMAEIISLSDNKLELFLNKKNNITFIALP